MCRLLVVTLFFGLCTARTFAVDREVAVSLSVPDAGWTLRIDRVVRVGDELWVVATVHRDPNTVAAQVITTLTDSVTVPVDDPDRPVVCYILGKTWGWANDEGHTFIDDMDAIARQLDGGRTLYRRPAPGGS